MSRKVFHVGIDLDIHAVSCPGVWLCPKGDAMLRISMLGASSHTKRVEPTFPMLFHENFHFRKTLTGVTSLAGLQAELRQRSVVIQLVQWEVHGCRCVMLAVFRSSLAELLYPQPASRGLVAGVDIDLLMEPMPCFPGIIAPKVEVSTKVVVEEMVNYPSRDLESLIISHKTLSSKRTCHPVEKEGGIKNEARQQSKAGEGRSRLRQKPVCHTRPNVRCYSCKKGGARRSRGRGRGGERGWAHCDCVAERANTLYLPYCKNCGDVVEETEVKQGKIILKEGSLHTEKWETVCPCVEPQRSKSSCDCNLCRKYQDLFRNSVPSPLPSNLTTNPAPKLRFDRSQSPPKKDKCCPCVSDKSGEGISRVRAGTSDKPSLEDTGDCPSGVARARSGGDYLSLFSVDLDAHYRQLYERVSRRSNRRGN